MEDNKNEALSAKEKYQTAVESASDYIEHFDLLETITNVGNDEVFTPRKTCNMLLDILPEEVWHNPNYKWLNPATKNGIFEREIALRLDEGLKDIITDEETRRKHILQNMIYSIGQTKFTSNVARRTLYYCSEANRKCDGLKADDGHYINGYAIGNGTWFDTAEGNIYTPKVEHFYEGKGKNKKCKFCGISEDSKYNDVLQREHYAYEFIHHKSHHLQYEFRKMFFKGDANMKFDIIIGNPPYQLSDGGAQASSKPIYNLFIEQAINLNPKYLCMIVPSRWFVGGKGLDSFREKMLTNTHLKTLHDYVNAKECFPNNDIKGGVCYFLFDRDYDGKCDIYTHSNEKVTHSCRKLKEEGIDVFIRQEELVLINNKVSQAGDESFSNIVSARKPYGLEAETMQKASKYGLPEFSSTKIDGGYSIFGLGEKMKRTWKYLPKDYPIPKKSECFDKYKVFIAEAYGCGNIGEVPSTPVLSTPGQCCTETFLEIGPFDTEKEAANVIKYIKTKFFRTLVSIQKQTQHTTQKAYKFVPMQNFTDNSDINWNQDISDIDKQLFKKYKLDSEDIAFIEENISEVGNIEIQDVSAEGSDDDE